MSGHSKWAKIKRQKGAKDAKRGALFTKIAKNITLAAAEGGGDIDTNFSLRLAVEKAKAANMPSDNIARAIKRGTGEGQKLTIQRISYEASLPGNVAILIDCQTDNTNRTVAEVRKLVENAGGKFVPAGSVSWQFQEKGLIVVAPAKLKKAEKYGKEDTYDAVDPEEAQLELLEIAGINDIGSFEQEDDEAKTMLLQLYTGRSEFAKVLREVEKLDYKVESAELVKEANDKIPGEISVQQSVQRLVDELEDHDDVDAVWTNLEGVG
jgi:YebC/PmpR family DNA-binding regulatory protein